MSILFKGNLLVADVAVGHGDARSRNDARERTRGTAQPGYDAEALADATCARGRERGWTRN
jgi:hypothetical protein